MATVRWSNGQIDRARSWEDLLDLVRKTQWAVMDEDEFRGVMAKRAWRWSHTSVDTGATAEEFFAELQRAKLIEVLNDNDDGKEN